MKYNKGEWSEAYAFVKLLGEGEVYGADEELNKKPDEVYPILKIIRDKIKRMYISNKENNMIEIADLDGNIKDAISVEEFLNVADITLDMILNSKGTTFKIPVLENFLNGLEIIQFKSRSRKKSDLKMELLDLKTDIEKEFTFSVKSEIGTKATLLNASNATNFLYEIEGLSNFDYMELNSINKETNRHWLKARMAKLIDGLDKKKYALKFIKTINENFNFNLQLIDSKLDYIIAVMLIDFSSNHGISDIKTLTERITKLNPLKVAEGSKELFYKTKIIDLIKASTFGMIPSEKWDKEYEVTGGILNVKRSGDVLCHHIFYDRKALDEYLYRNTKFETASTSRYGTGHIFEENNSHFFTLNLQIRMK